MNPQLKDVMVEMLGAQMSGITSDLRGFKDGILLKMATDSQKSVTKIKQQTSKLVLDAMPHTAPGPHCECSNMNYIILGAILEKLTGLPWGSLMASMIFNPLDMKSCGFGTSGNASSPDPNQPLGHRRTSAGMNSFLPHSSADKPPASGPRARRIVPWRLGKVFEES